MKTSRGEPIWLSAAVSIPRRNEVREGGLRAVVAATSVALSRYNPPRSSWLPVPFGAVAAQPVGYGCGSGLRRFVSHDIRKQASTCSPNTAASAIAGSPPRPTTRHARMVAARAPTTPNE